jgi:hypothetical protein
MLALDPFPTLRPLYYGNSICLTSTYEPIVSKHISNYQKNAEKNIHMYIQTF